MNEFTRREFWTPVRVLLTLTYALSFVVLFFVL